MSYTPTSKKTFRVATKGGEFTSLADCITYLGTLSDTEGVRIVIDGGNYNITDTITINLTMPITIEGAGSSSTVLQAATGLLNKNMFVIKSDTNFDKIELLGNTLSGWPAGTNATLLKFDTAGVYSELTSINLVGAKKAIEITGAASVFCFNFVIDTATTGIEINTTGKPSLDIEVCNITGCTKGIDLIAGSTADIFLMTTRFLNPSAGVGLTYNGTTFTYNNFTVSGCEWNNVGTFFSGFNFTLARDANIEVLNCVGIENKSPHAKINVDGAVATQSLSATTWTKSSFVNTNSYTCKWGIANNKITFLSDHQKSGLFWISANFTTSSQPCDMKIAIVKNGNPATVYGKQSIFLDINNRPFQVSMNVYLEDIVKNDYFEIWLYTAGAETVVLQDLNWIIDTK